jgi:hypothetical protein
LLGAVAMALAWLVLVFVSHVPSGAVHLLYAVSIMLFARRILVGAPRFVS